MTNKRPLARLFPILLLNLTGFAIAIPVLPSLAFALGGSAVDIGLLYALQSLGQFVMAPLWGSLSDRFGRKNILMGTFAAAALMELFTALVPSLILLYVARFLVGLCAGNVATATALISDATDSANRSKGMAIVGISFGIGFTLGPAIGAGVSLLAVDGPGILGAGLPFAVSAAMSVVTFILAAFVLVEPTQDTEARRQNRLERRPRSIRQQLRSAPIFTMCALFLFYTISLTILEGTFFVYMAHIYDYDVAQVGIIFAIMGLLMAVVQGGVGPVSRALGDRHMTGLGLVLLAAGLIAAPFTGELWWLFIFLGIATVGRAFIHPGILSMTSRLAAHKGETGQLMGILQSAASMGRIIGPAIGGFIFAYVHPAAPFWFGGILLAVTTIWWWLAAQRQPALVGE